MTCKHSAKRGERGNCKTYRFEGAVLLTAFATHFLMSLTLVVAWKRYLAWIHLNNEGIVAGGDDARVRLIRKRVAKAVNRTTPSKRYVLQLPRSPRFAECLHVMLLAPGPPPATMPSLLHIVAGGATMKASSQVAVPVQAA